MWTPTTLSDIVGQPPTKHLAHFSRFPCEKCFLFEGPPGVGKSASARCLANDMGIDEWAGLIIHPASELNIDECRELFERILRLRPLFGSPWKMLLIEELDGLASKQVERYLKVNLEILPPYTVVVATSNGAEGIDGALLQRFDIYPFSGGPTFAADCQKKARRKLRNCGRRERPKISQLIGRTGGMLSLWRRNRTSPCAWR